MSVGETDSSTGHERLSIVVLTSLVFAPGLRLVALGEIREDPRRSGTRCRKTSGPSAEPGGQLALLIAALAPKDDAAAVDGLDVKARVDVAARLALDHLAHGLMGMNAVRTRRGIPDRKSTRLNSSHANISYAVFCL